MEALILYFIKANGLLLVFYLAYYFLLRKETFFSQNRWFLLSGLIVSVVLPMITFTKTIWVEPTPVLYQSTSNDSIPYIIENRVVHESIDWNAILLNIYLTIAVVFAIRIIAELVSFFKILKYGKRVKSDKITLIDNESNRNPFSFFNYIVYNSQSFSEEELQHIITHENIHVTEKHSIDVLVTKLFCALFWINPIMWFYKNEILQNLEYIADHKASTITQNRIEYQKTLLKVVTHQNHLSITNQFYQSLIKKRIVMLNTNPSNQRNSWKYALILPVLSAFMLLFQVETVAQVKEKNENENETKITLDEKTLSFEPKNSDSTKYNTVRETLIYSDKGIHSVEVIQFIIDKNTTNIEIEKETKRLKEEYGIELKISKIKRNKQNEIIALEAKFKDSNKTTGHVSIRSDNPIEPIRFFKELGDDGKVGFDRNNTSTVFTKIDANNNNSKEVQISWHDASKSSKKQKSESNRLYIINGKEVQENEILQGTTLEVDGAIIELSKEEGVKKYGPKGKDGVLILERKSKFKNDENVVIYIDGKEVSEKEMDKLDSKEIAYMNVNRSDAKNEIRIHTKSSKGIDDKTTRIIEIEKKKIDAEIAKAKAEIEKAKIEIEKSRPEMEKAKLEMERAKKEMEKAKAQMDFEWKEKHEKMEKAEIEKMRDELEKAKEEILKAREEILKAKKEIELSRKNSKE